MQLVQANDTGTFLPDGLYAGPGWTAAHGSSLATYGFAVAARLVDGPGGSEAFKSALREHSAGWAISPSDSLADVDLSTLDRAVALHKVAEAWNQIGAGSCPFG